MVYYLYSHYPYMNSYNLSSSTTLCYVLILPIAAFCFSILGDWNVFLAVVGRLYCELPIIKINNNINNHSK